MPERRTALPILIFFAACDGGASTGKDPSETGTTGTPPDDTAGETGETDTAETGETAETGDTGDTAPTGEACVFDPLLALPAGAIPASIQVGAFAVAFSDGGAALEITHADTGARPVFRSASGGFVYGDRGWLDVEERQGSFDLRESVNAACGAPELVEAVIDPVAGAVLRGGWSGCAGSVEVRICQPEEGHLQVDVRSDVDRLTLRAESSADEHIYGLGAQAPVASLDLKGLEIPLVAQEGGIGRGHPIITPAVNLYSEGSGGSEVTNYAPAASWFTSSMQAVILENEQATIMDLTDDARTEARVWSPQLTFRVVAGDTPKALLTRISSFTGRMPALPAWVNEGAIVALARPLDEGLALLDGMLARGAAISGVWNQTWSGVAETWVGEQVLWNWVQNPDTHPGWSGWVDALADRGVRTLCYVNPMFVDPAALGQEVDRSLYDEAWAGGYFVRDSAGEVLLQQVTAFEVGLLDLSDEAARAWMKQVIVDEVIGAGCSGWMADFAEALPFEAVMRDGEDGAVWHNRYPVEWARLHREVVEEQGLLGDALVFHRSGFTGTPRHAILMWQGDQLTTWDEYDGLVNALHGVIAAGLGGVQLTHSDIGGYTSLSWLGLGYDREAEQLMRWAEMSAFTAVMRTHEGNQPDYNAQVYDDDVIDHFARMTRVYRALAPYRAELMEDVEARGWPLVRHLLLEFPDDPASWEVDDEFMLGSEILVAPIQNKCWTAPWCPYDKEVYLPPGEWSHLWTGDIYGDPGSGTTVSVTANLGEPAVFIRRYSAAGATFRQNLRAEGIEVPEE